MAIKSGPIIIQAESPPVTVETKLTQLNLWDRVKPLLYDSRFDAKIRADILCVPVRENRSIDLAGYWKRADRIIYLNQLLVCDHEIETFLHELAHCVADTIYGYWIQAHGNEWRNIMIAFGLEPERCHEYNLRNYGSVSPNRRRKR